MLKSKDFIFLIPITSLEKIKGLFSSAKVGDLQVCGKFKVLAIPVDSPYALMKPEERKWAEITISEVFWQYADDKGPQEANITLLLRHMKEAWGINQAIMEAAANQALFIYQENFAK